MNEPLDQLYSQEYFEYLQNRSQIRKLIRKYYLHDISKYCIDKTIDFGCGTGELLKLLPDASIGFEVNKKVVDYCRQNGLTVSLYSPEKDDYRFDMVEKGEFKTLTMNHVLEHIENSKEVIRKIFRSCYRLGVSRIVFTVPGHKGFLSDNTHRTFIDLKYFKENDLLDDKFYNLKLFKYFPINSPKFSKFFTHNEFRLIFDKRE